MTKYDDISSKLMKSPSLPNNIVKTFHNAANSLKDYLGIPEKDENRFIFLKPDLAKTDKAFIYQSNDFPGSSWEMKIAISFLSHDSIPIGTLEMSYVIRILGNDAVIYACLSERSIKTPMAQLPYNIAPIPIDSFSDFNNAILENAGEFLHEIASNTSGLSPDSYINH